MTVRELIEALGEYDPDLLVVGRGYERGYEDVVPRMVRVLKDDNAGPNRKWYFGRHSDGDGYDSPLPGSVEAVCL